MAEFIAYVAESSAAPAADGPDAGHHRMAVAVLAPAAVLADAAARLEAAWAGPPAGSDPDAIGATDAADAAALRRLDWLASAGIRCHAVVVDRREAAPDTGRLQGRSVEQVVHGAIHEAVAGSPQETEVRTGAAAVAALAAGLARHAAERWEADLFRPVPPVRAAERGAAPMRLAGLLLRRLGRCYRDEAARGSADPALRELLRAGWLTLEEWPPAHDRDPPARTIGGDRSDTAIRRAAVESAWRFIAGTPNPRDEDGRVQRLVLKHLLGTALHGDAGYASSGELLDLLAARGYGTLKEHHLQSAIIAGLRDSGVLVTSSSQGYKIPQSQQDVMDFASLVDGQVIPLLERLARVRRVLGAAGEGAARPLADARYAKLQRVLDALEDGSPSTAPAAPLDGTASGDR